MPKFKSGDRVAFDIGRRTVVGILTQPYCSGTKFGVATDAGEYTMLVVDLRKH